MLLSSFYILIVDGGIWRNLVLNEVYRDLSSVFFFCWIEKTKIFDFFYLVKSTLLILTNITKVNLLSISLV